MKLEGKRALVTGGTEGIGWGIAEALGDRGAQVGVVGRDQQKLRRAAEELGVHPLRGDVGVEKDAVRVVREFVEQFGGIDVLVNNAGFGHFMPLLETDAARFEEVFRTNVTGAMLMARECARHFVQQRSGSIVNIGSTSGLYGGKNSTAYSGSKFALRGMTECWRAELRPHDVRVTLVNPSEVQTPFFTKLGVEKPYSEKKLRAEDIAVAVVAALELDDRGFIPEFAVFATNPWEPEG
ncbi:MAG: SDR family oxidoreductase [Candidatus Krumholzibacteriia bacterium]